ncbi:hypothetical protein BTHI11S_01686 [Bosea thiooxidans]
MVKSKEWQEILEAHGWDHSFLAGAAFETFLKNEIERVSKVMTEVGLVKMTTPSCRSDGGRGDQAPFSHLKKRLEGASLTAGTP